MMVSKFIRGILPVVYSFFLLCSISVMNIPQFVYTVDVFFNFFNVFILFLRERERERDAVRAGEGHRETETESEAGSRL